MSGRGVGMDVVNRQMEMINGSVDASSLGVYTQITLKIPLPGNNRRTFVRIETIPM